MAKSKPLRLRGLKFALASSILLEPSVEAFAASWIEIVAFSVMSGNCKVEAFAASWIEMTQSFQVRIDGIVEAFAASWIEIYYVLMVI